MELFVLVGVGGALGATARQAVHKYVDTDGFPWATLFVNALGSFILGLVIFGGVSSELVLLLGVGFCGAFTTFSSFSVQIVDHWERGDRHIAVANAVGSFLVAFSGFMAASWLATWIM